MRETEAKKGGSGVGKKEGVKGATIKKGKIKCLMAREELSVCVSWGKISRGTRVAKTHRMPLVAGHFPHKSHSL